MNEDTSISSKHRVRDWKELRSALVQPFKREPWEKAVEILRDRIDSRFFSAIHRLQFDRTGTVLGWGFAILALDCLLIDTIQSFREGRAKSSEEGVARAFRNFLRRPNSVFSSYFTTNSQAGRFFDCVRCGLLHDGETRKGWKVWKHSTEGKLVERVDGGWILYRDNFHDALEKEFTSYLDDLLKPEFQQLRENFCKRMDALCGINVKRQAQSFAFQKLCAFLSRINKNRGVKN